jgi:hypothetical protein
LADLDTEELKRKARHFKKLIREGEDHPESREEIDEMVAEYQQQSAAVLPQSMQSEEQGKRHFWTLEEDRYLLTSFVKYGLFQRLDLCTYMPCSSIPGMGVQNVLPNFSTQAAPGRQGMCRWHAVAGFKEKAYRTQTRPMMGITVNERQAARRIRELQQTAHVSPSFTSADQSCNHGCGGMELCQAWRRFTGKHSSN